ncbi:carboxypeptidase-like regulatory domain-containing protein [candidate division KSB1 bacterium]|nr:carboxypeptidase-like regulatory domain-containing protein [candidate division KSB1 bacterium]NIR71309.1 carboxypeptidase-like regulatory domain-containing protein [candidate division KSB1 bacterium]NIS27930.1 carboxypeptidase-like regulatory domain-containing protein [candidate division KSB1 bacterium]NIT74811.1 carboxypeptidase-like regulatory domain-containing protein [candidate division KSB1 bacterium]NIU28589.1 carboxypeptidase-like regulatory domain-containing protein [candidate divisi
MKAKHYLISSSISIVAILLFTFCTSNPIDDGDIAQRNRKVSGKVVLGDENVLEGIFVWLEGIDISSRTDESGNFTLTLPPPGNQSAGGGLDGVFNLYYYVANYGLKKSVVVIQDGEFQYSRADLNKDGEILQPVNLEKFLNIETEVTPDEVAVNAGQRIGATVRLSSVSDSVSVVFPNSFGGFLGAIFLRNVENREQVFIIEGPPSQLKDQVLVTSDGHSRTLVFDLVRNPIPAGSYEVIPYLLVAHEDVPDELIESLGNKVKDLTPNYLDIPFRREVAILKVGAN